MKRRYATIPYILGIFLYIFTKQVDGQILKVGGCPTVTPNAASTFLAGNNPFQNPSFGILGQTTTWTEVRRFSTIWENSLRCVTYTFTQTSALAVQPVTNTATITGIKKILRTLVTITGTVTQTSAANANIFTASYTGTGAGGLFFSNIYPTSYTVAGADSSIVPTAIVLYSCEAVGLLSIQDAWVLVTGGFTQATINTAITNARAAGVPIQFFKRTLTC